MQKKKEQQRKWHLVFQTVMFVLYILLGIVLFVTHRHCRADLPIYIVGIVVAAVCMAGITVHDLKQK